MSSLLFPALAITLLLSSLTSFAAGPGRAAAARGMIVLIPGTFSALVPASLRKAPGPPIAPYFSRDIVEALSSRGLAVLTIPSLVPLGSFEANGEKVLAQIHQAYDAYSPAHELPLTLLGHSAGGFYALYVASRAGELPIRKVITVSTPLGGLELADRALGGGLAWLLDQAQGPLALQGLTELTSVRVKDFLDQLAFANDLEILHVAGGLPTTALNPLFSLTQALIGSPGDGLVSDQSAYGGRWPLTRFDGQPARETARPDLFIPLDHAEQVVDYRFFAKFGRPHPERIREKQREAYERLGAIAASE